MIRPTANVILAVVSFQMAKRQLYRLSSGQLLCQILLTRAQGTCLGESYRKPPAKNVLCSNGNTKNTKTSYLLFVQALGKEWRERVRRRSRTEASTLSGPLVATGHTKKREDDIVLLLYVVSLSTALAPFLLRALRCG